MKLFLPFVRSDKKTFFRSFRFRFTLDRFSPSFPPSLGSFLHSFLNFSANGNSCDGSVPELRPLQIKRRLMLRPD